MSAGGLEESMGDFGGLGTAAKNNLNKKGGKGKWKRVAEWAIFNL